MIINQIQESFFNKSKQKRVMNLEELKEQEIDLTKVYEYAEFPDKILSRPKS